MVNPQADLNRIVAFTYSALLATKPGHLEPSTGELQGSLAESYEVSPDGLTITFKLRNGAKFHNKPPVNGRVFDTDDVDFSFKHYKELGPLASLVFNDNSPDAPVLSSEYPDKSTVVLKLKDPIVFVPNWFAAFGSFTGQIGMYPKEADGGGLDLKTDMIGTGPYMLTEHQPSIKFVLSRHPEYWDDKAAMVDSIEMPVVPDYTSRTTQLQAGNIYYADNSRVTLHGPDILALLDAEPRIKLYRAPFSTSASTVVTFGHLPVGANKFQDERVRQAISMSWDRDLWIAAKFNTDKFEDAGLSVDTKWNSHLQYEDSFDAGGWWLDPQGADFGENAKYFQYNLEEAKKLLDAAGFDTGEEVEVRYPNAAQYTLVDDAQLIIGFLQGLGLKIKDTGITDYTQDYIPNDRDASGAFEGMGIHSVTGSTPTHIHPISSLVAQHLPSSGVTFHGYDITGAGDESGDPQLIDMLQKAQTSQDVETQKSLIKDAQRYLAKGMYSMFMPGTANEFFVAWPAVKNFRVWDGGTDETWEKYAWWLDPTEAPLA
jgi:peptide/nickel transport system substrate-binding protein